MKEFISAAFPWVMMGMVLGAIYRGEDASKGRKDGDKEED